jgi:hypothetical protein
MFACACVCAHLAFAKDHKDVRFITRLCPAFAECTVVAAVCSCVDACRHDWQHSAQLAMRHLYEVAVKSLKIQSCHTCLLLFASMCGHLSWAALGSGRISMQR